MGILDVFKNKDASVPPDVGKEEVDPSDAHQKSMDDNSEDTGRELDEISEKEKNRNDDEKPRKKAASPHKNYSIRDDNEMQNLVLEKLEARIEVANTMIKGLNERFAMINQQIGELRAGHLENEKSLSRMSIEAAKSIDIVKEVKPEKFRFDFQKIDAKVEELSGKIDSNKQFMEGIMNEVKELRRESSFFAGSDALIKLNEEVKKDLIATQQLAAKTKMHADKSEQIFIEMRSTTAENQKISSLVSNLDANYSNLNNYLEKLKLDFQNIATKREVVDLKRYIDTRLFALDQTSSELKEYREDHARLVRVIESMAGIINQNKQDISDIAMSLGDSRIRKVTDYDARLISILHVLDSLAGQIVKIKKAVGMKSEEKKIQAKPAGKKKIEEENFGMKHIEVHPKLSESLSPPVPEEETDEKKAEAEETESGDSKPEGEQVGDGEVDEEESPEIDDIQKQISELLKRSEYRKATSRTNH